jgi:hypothetical protein
LIARGKPLHLLTVEEVHHETLVLVHVLVGMRTQPVVRIAGVAGRVDVDSARFENAPNLT